MNKLFAIDENNQEVIVSESPVGSKKIIPNERISKNANNTLYYAVMTLSNMTMEDDLDLSIFKAMDKICQKMYAKHKGVK
jgi:hypothetical protein